ncbi:MAG: hypothetical protein ABH803_03845 [Candidatus Micrarchaeota archaeon]
MSTPRELALHLLEHAFDNGFQVIPRYKEGALNCYCKIKGEGRNEAIDSLMHVAFETSNSLRKLNAKHKLFHKTGGKHNQPVVSLKFNGFTELDYDALEKRIIDEKRNRELL